MRVNCHDLITGPTWLSIFPVTVTLRVPIFSLDGEGNIVTLRAEIPKENPAIDSITDVTNGSNFIEREIHDFFGIDFRGHPELKRLVLSDDWPKGKYPLRKGE